MEEKRRILTVVIVGALVLSSLALTGCVQEEEETLVETTLYVPDDERADEMQVVKEQAKEAGFKINLEKQEWGSYIEDVQAGNAPLSYSGWSGPTSPMGSLNYMMNGSAWAFYSGWYSSENYTNKVEKGVTETDESERYQLYKDAQEILVDEDMGTFVTYTQREPRAYRESVEIPDESWNPHMGAGPLVVAEEWNVDGSDTINIAQTHEPQDFHPIRYTDVYSGYIFTQMFDPLISTYPEGSVTTNPSTVAEDFEISDDAKTMTFDIKEGIKFHDGEELDAHDVEFTINTMMPHEKEYMGPNEDENYTDLYDVEKSQASPRAGDFSNVDYVEATDNYTLEIHMENADMELLQKEGMEYLYVLPKDYIEENGWETFGDEMIGSGPYEFDHYNEGDEVLLTESDNYDRKDVNTPEILFDFYDEESTAVTALRDGETHYMSRIGADNWYSLQDEDGVKTESYQSMGHNRIAFNHNMEPWDDPKVRKAFAYAINATELIEVNYGQELADNTRSPIPPSHPAHNEDLMMYERDPDKARDLLKDAGY